MLRSDDQPAPSIGPLTASDLPRAAAVLARAFRDNALNTAVVRSNDPNRRLRSNLHGMRALLPLARTHGYVISATLDGRVSGVLVAVPPGAFPLPSPPLVSRLRCLLGQGPMVAQRWSEVFELLETQHPQGPHWYLGTIGVDPSLQGRGVGEALLSNWLGEVEASGQPAYLETDTERNVSFYERVGFEVEGEMRILEVRVWRMQRLARGMLANSQY